MKIKEVCDKTGLTDKAVRHYIRNGLVFPSYDENYTGRKNFEFSENDITRLNQIAILRKYRLSIKSIKQLVDNKINLSQLIEEHIDMLTKESNDDIKIINDLKQFDNLKDIDFQEFCVKLDELNNSRELPEEDSLPPYKILYEKLKKHELIIEISIVLLTALVFIILILHSDGFAEKFYGFVEAVTNTEKIHITIIFLAFDICATITLILLIYNFINRENSEKRFKALSACCFIVNDICIFMMSILFVWWFALIVNALIIVSFKSQEKYLFNQEISNQKRKSIYDESIDISKYRCKVKDLIINSIISYSAAEIILFRLSL